MTSIMPVKRIVAPFSQTPVNGKRKMSFSKQREEKCNLYEA
jgi:hypothetical protein